MRKGSGGHYVSRCGEGNNANDSQEVKKITEEDQEQIISRCFRLF
jgi:hypothetical protein